jgi:hypothetical protein
MKSGILLGFAVGLVTLPIWTGPFLWDVLRTPPRRWT